jgi:hypothetical protein
MSHGQNVAGQNVARQNVADISSRTKCCGQIVADKMLHGQNVARTKRCKKKRRRMNKWLRRTKSCVDQMVHGSFVGNLELLVTSNVKQISRYNLFFTLIP